MAIKLKPVRGEISATNPNPDQGASILNAVIQSDPNIQSTVNTLGALTEREKTHRQNLEKVRIANKVKLSVFTEELGNINIVDTKMYSHKLDPLHSFDT